MTRLIAVLAIVVGCTDDSEVSCADGNELCENVCFAVAAEGPSFDSYGENVRGTCTAVSLDGNSTVTCRSVHRLENGDVGCCAGEWHDCQ